MALSKVRVWLNAFIPNSVCELHGDFFAIRVPTGELFTGDQREFSSAIDDQTVTSRMQSVAVITGLDTDQPSFAQAQVCGESHKIDEDGNIVASATATTTGMKFENLRGEQTTDPQGGIVDDGIPGSIQLDLEGSASLPLLGIAPDIDYSGTFIIDRSEGNVLFKGAISGFPAFELYFQADDGPVQMLGQFAPISPLDLIGEEDRSVSLSAQIM